ncbi:uncharacterized protein B0I36DRAFT_96308 [Microdochium trichocladiopsis]|uniref:Uncharacterized protein n=1 Tax=Microdochium trichocladiopsis TaxID=1682393 RepID=A0A9P8YF00_9PEZI|nr:uncharacterized protein B0I36DRAFT_96308 [Microdochium trichocladiopsis]KAH7035741.1 hypothetical protein B0I36DRAFT_96308 [Microdochium trichocladiopsis]
MATHALTPKLSIVVPASGRARRLHLHHHLLGPAHSCTEPFHDDDAFLPPRPFQTQPPSPPTSQRLPFPNIARPCVLALPLLPATKRDALTQQHLLTPVSDESAAGVWLPGQSREVHDQLQHIDALHSLASRPKYGHILISPRPASVHCDAQQPFSVHISNPHQLANLYGGYAIR